MRTNSWLPAALCAGVACASGPEPLPGPPSSPSKPSPTDTLIASLPPAKLLPATDAQRKIDASLDAFFGRAATRRGHIMTDKPLYQPGETIWFRASLRQTASLVASGPGGVSVKLVSPRGAVVREKRVLAADGVAANDFELPAEAEGGEFTLRLDADDGTTLEKKLIVSSYEAPRFQKELEFLRKAYGPGDSASAAIAVKRATGEPHAGKPLVGVVTVDDVEVARVPATTDAEGKAVLRFALPASIERGDGLLTVLVADGGVTESIQKRIPIILRALDVAFFPEGGDLVEGLPGRVYLAAKNSLGKPADVEGKVVDDRGDTVATFTSVRDGMARFELTPGAGRAYRVEITRPAGIAKTFELPAARRGGCVLRATDGPGLELAAWCTEAQTLTVEAALRERRIASAAVELAARAPVRIALPLDESLQGAVRVTLFDAAQNPVAERLVYRGRGRDLRVSVEPDRKSYAPRDPVTLTVKTTDLAGKPVKASLGVAVVDDTVLSFADDKSARILASLYLEPELVGSGPPLEEPNFYFSDKPEAGAAMDLLMGTRGWRRFDWQLVFAPPVPETTTAEAPGEGRVAMRPDRRPRPAAAVKPMPEPKKVAVADKGKKLPAAEPAAPPPPPPPADQPVVAGVAARRPAGPMEKRQMAREEMAADELWEGERDDRVAWAPVRVFPAPSYTPGYDGPRTDYRETLHWAHDVRTGADGTAKLTFHLSDAVTSFRATAEGLSEGGLPGRGEAVVQSKMPLSLDARLPLEVSAGDKISLPVTLTNETDRAVTGELTALFGAAFKLDRDPAGAGGKITLAAGERKTLFYPLVVTGSSGESEMFISIDSEGLHDEIKKKVRVVPLGFPFEVSLSGTLDGRARHTVNLAGALPGSVMATVTMYPSPLATMTQGLQGMIREPGGCFEQTSSSNYPNVMVLNYLGAHDGADAALVARTQGVLDKGYKLLTGYETKEKGYEWFGQTPGHEALTAYGIMQFEDMARVHEVDRTMVERTSAWLLSRRDGKGGFLRSSQALDSFGRANAATTDGYIVWALSEAKRTKGLDVELAVQRKVGLESDDPYLVAMAANTMLNVAPGAGETAAIVKRLAAMQGKDGSFPGAKQTITMSGGEALLIETTALAALAFVKASAGGEREGELRQAVDWLNGHRGGYGEWGSTQATILSLKALGAYAEHSRQTQASGTAVLLVNGKQAGRVSFEKGRRDAIVFEDLAGSLEPGDNVLELVMEGEAKMPYSIAIGYRSARPQSSDAAKVAVTTSLAKGSVKMGEGVKLRARIENRTGDGVPMTLARVGIPGGLVFQTWQLKELRDKGLIDFYETRPREVILYWRALPPSAKKEIDLDLLAAVPGTYVAPATSAYLYYTDEDKAWTEPVTVSVER